MALVPMTQQKGAANFMQQTKSYRSAIEQGSRTDFVRANRPKMTLTRTDLNLRAADETPAETAASKLAIFRSAQNAFYTIYSPKYMGYQGTFGFAGIRGRIGFTNLSNTQTVEWEYGVYGDGEQPDVVKSTDNQLIVDLEPMKRFTYPSLAAKFDDATVESAESDIVQYYCGSSTWGWGFYPSESEEVNIDEIIGVGNCAGDVSTIDLDVMSLNRSDEKLTNGVSADIAGALTQSYAQNGITVSNIAIKGYTAIIPQQTSPYLLHSLYLNFDSKATADYVLTANVYAINEKGQITDQLVGTGSVTVHSGDFPTTNAQGEATEDIPVFEMQAIVDGQPVEEAPAIDGPVAVCIEGLDNPALTVFAPMFNAASQFPAAMSIDEVRECNMWPTHAYMNYTFDYSVPGEGEGAEPTTGSSESMTSAPWIWTLNGSNNWLVASDFLIGYGVEFPITMDLNTGKSEFAIELAAGTEGSIQVDASYDLAALVNEGVATIEKVNGDWFTFTADNEDVQFEENTYPIYTINVTAEALPEGTSGRTGYIVYKGYACDFVVTVTQGEESGIQTVVTPVNGSKAQYFDMMGRKLNAAPAAGVYIERTGNKATKRIAR